MLNPSHEARERSDLVRGDSVGGNFTRLDSVSGDLRGEIGARAKAFVREHCDRDRNAARLEEFLQLLAALREILARRGVGAVQERGGVGDDAQGP